MHKESKETCCNRRKTFRPFPFDGGNRSKFCRLSEVRWGCILLISARVDGCHEIYEYEACKVLSSSLPLKLSDHGAMGLFHILGLNYSSPLI